ncbi:hypothetical protein HKBW3S03_01796, partial [Candidatus Hakubella thermalkaliphila]
FRGEVGDEFLKLEFLDSLLIFLGYEAGLPLTSSFGIVVILAVLFFAFYLIVLGPPSRWRR